MTPLRKRLLYWLLGAVFVSAGLLLYVQVAYPTRQTALESSTSIADGICSGPPLRTAAAREQALTDGYDINPRFDCIDKKSVDAARAEQAKSQETQSAPDKARFAQENAQKQEERERQFSERIRQKAAEKQWEEDKAKLRNGIDLPAERDPN